MLRKVLPTAAVIAVCLVITPSTASAQKNSGLSIKKETATLNNGSKILREASIADEDLATVWEVVESADRQVKNDQSGATNLNCQKLTSDVSSAKDIVVSAKPNLRQDLLLSFFEKKRGVVTCGRPAGDKLLDDGRSEIGSKKCLISYRTWTDDPLREILPDYIVISDIEGFNAHWISVHPEDKALCRQSDRWMVAPRVELTTAPR